MIKILVNAIIIALFLGLTSVASIRSKRNRDKWDCNQFDIVNNKNGGYDLDVLCVFSKDRSSKRFFVYDVQNCKKAPAYLKTSKFCKITQDTLSIQCGKQEIEANKIVRFRSENSKQKISNGVICA